MTVTDYLAQENVWLEKSKYDTAERIHYESKSKETSTPLAAEVSKAREWLTNIKNTVENGSSLGHPQELNTVLQKGMDAIEEKLEALLDRIVRLENHVYSTKDQSMNVKVTHNTLTATEEDVDLFASDSEEDEAAEEVKLKRLADYENKKSKKPALIAKSSVLMDIKPWDDETDMKAMETEVRKIEMDGLVWGASKLVPLAYGICKLQVMVVIEDEKVSVDILQEQIESIEDYVQSVDIAAFNKI